MLPRLSWQHQRYADDRDEQQKDDAFNHDPSPLSSGGNLTSRAICMYSDATISAQRPTHSLQILQPSLVMMRKTSSGRLPQNEQLAMDDPPQPVRCLQRSMLKRVLNNLVGFGRESAEAFPIGNSRTMLGAGYRHHGHVAAEGSDYFVNGFQFLCHSSIIHIS
jgi:hypothetical protein